MPKGLNLRYLHYYLPQTITESNFAGGICRDLPPYAIPPGFLYDCVDFNLDRPGIVYKRGAITKYCPAVGAVDGNYFITSALFNGSLKLVGKMQDGHLWNISPGGNTDVGAFTITPVDYPKVYPGSVDKLIVPAGDGTSVPKKVYLSAGVPTFANLGGSPPAGKYVAVHQNRVVLAGATATPNRLYFGPAPDTESTWDTANSFIDTTYPITSIASIQGVLLVFSTGFCERIIGDIPPGLEGENMSIQPLGSIGCTNPLSIKEWNNNIIFANGEGVYVTNGAGFDSLTDKPNGTGIASLWQASFASFLPTVGALYNQKMYIVSVNDTTTYVCYLPTKTWWRVTYHFNWATENAGQSAGEVYAIGNNYGGRANQVFTLSETFNPIAGISVAAITDMTSITFLPTMTTRMIGDGVGLKAYEHGHLTYNMVDFNADHPRVAIEYSRGAEIEGPVQSVPESPLVPTVVSADNNFVQRKRFSLNIDAQAIYMTIRQAVTYADILEILSLEVEVRDATYGSFADFVNI